MFLKKSFDRPTNAIDTLVMRVIDQVMPEVKARRLHLDLDLDHVRVDVLVDDIVVAVRNLIVNAIQWAEFNAEISITLIDSPGMGTPGQWELEVCDFASRTTDDSDPWQTPMNCRLDDQSETIGPWPQQSDATMTIASAVRAAARCQGAIEAWHCPQGGIAMILVMPKTRARMVA